MNFNDFIGCPLADIVDYCKSNNIEYTVTELETTKLNYDTMLVVKVQVLEDKVNIIVDRFLLEI